MGTLFPWEWHRITMGAADRGFLGLRDAVSTVVEAFPSAFPAVQYLLQCSVIITETVSIPVLCRETRNEWDVISCSDLQCSMQTWRVVCTCSMDCGFTRELGGQTKGQLIATSWWLFSLQQNIWLLYGSASSSANWLPLLGSPTGRLRGEMSNFKSIKYLLYTCHIQDLYYHLASCLDYNINSILWSLPHPLPWINSSSFLLPPCTLLTTLYYNVMVSIQGTGCQYRETFLTICKGGCLKASLPPSVVKVLSCP